jgi:hypothetical protein
MGWRDRVQDLGHLACEDAETRPRLDDDFGRALRSLEPAKPQQVEVVFPLGSVYAVYGRCLVWRRVST